MHKCRTHMRKHVGVFCMEREHITKRESVCTMHLSSFAFRNDFKKPVRLHCIDVVCAIVHMFA
jgi:hypothetical protein